MVQLVIMRATILAIIMPVQGLAAVTADGANRIQRSNLADLRVVKGTAVYTAEFTPPTSPLTAVTNTQLLLQGVDAGIIDKSQSCTHTSFTKWSKIFHNTSKIFNFFH